LAGAAGIALAGCSDGERRETNVTDEINDTRDVDTGTNVDANANANANVNANANEDGVAYADRFGTVVDAVDAGADPNGETPVDGLVEEIVDDDTLVYFPAGRYRVGSVSFREPTRVGLVGPEATLIPDEPGANPRLVSFSEASDCVFVGFDLDATDPDRHGRVVFHAAGGTNVFEEYTVRGRFGDDAPKQAVNVKSVGTETRLRVEDLDLSDGGDVTGVFVNSPGGSDSAGVPGSIAFRNCTLVNWSEGLYASAHGGPLRVEGGRYENNGIVGVRVGGGGADTWGVVRGVTVVVDTSDLPDDRTYDNMRGIWLREGDRTLVEDCDVHIRSLDGTYSSGGVVVGKRQGRSIVRDTRVVVNAGTYGLNVRPPDRSATDLPSMDGLPKAWETTVENVELVGSATSLSAARVSNRPRTVFRNLQIDATGERDGLVVLGGEETVAEEVSVVAGRYPVLFSPRPGSGDCPFQLKRVRRLESRSVGHDTTVGARREGCFCLPFTQEMSTEASSVYGVTGRTGESLVGDLVSRETVAT
jgi:hypothetical protein